MSSQNKLQRERNQKQLLELVALPGNNICADCKTRNPRWASYNIGIFICMHCASIHRKIGTHITKVKSLTMDDWTKEQVEIMKSMGNIKSNAIHNPNELRHPPPPNLEDSERDSEIEQYIRSKYQYKKFLDKSALVASKLGPSRSVSSVVRSSPTPPAPSTKSPASLHQASANSSAKPAGSQRSVSATNAATPVNVKAPGNPSPSSRTTPTPTSAARGGVWDDLCSLTTRGQDSSLPLQFQAPSQSPMPGVNGAMNLNAYSPAPNGTVANSFQAQQMGLNSFPQQHLSPSSPYIPSLSPASSFSTNWSPAISQPATPIMPQPVSAATSFLQPQHQPSFQVQMSSSPGILSHSPSGQPVMSAPAMQTQFLTPSPSQQLLSHSPQLMAQQAGFALQSTPVMSATQFGVGPNMSFGLNSGSMSTAPMGQQAGFLSTTTMQMQQQQLLMQQQAQQQQQQQQLAQYQQQQFGSSMQTQMQQPMMFMGSNGFDGGAFGRQTYTQGQQWGPM